MVVVAFLNPAAVKVSNQPKCASTIKRQLIAAVFRESDENDVMSEYG